MGQHNKNAAAFSAALTEQLARHRLRQSDLARATNVSRSYINRLAKELAPSPEWVEIIANATCATDVERSALHRAAARGKGYKV